MKESINIGIGFGLTSGIITPLALMVGLTYSTNSKLAVIGGILTIAIADAFSDALGIHIAEESKKRSKSNQIWEATFSTFFTKLLVALTFLIPFLFFDLMKGVVIGLIWGFLVLVFSNYKLAKIRNESPLKIISEHLTLAIIVIAISYFLGKFVGAYFG